MKDHGGNEKQKQKEQQMMVPPPSPGAVIGYGRPDGILDTSGHSLMSTSSHHTGFESPTATRRKLPRKPVVSPYAVRGYGRPDEFLDSSSHHSSSSRRYCSWSPKKPPVGSGAAAGLNKSSHHNSATRNRRTWSSPKPPMVPIKPGAPLDSPVSWKDKSNHGNNSNDDDSNTSLSIPVPSVFDPREVVGGGSMHSTGGTVGTEGAAIHTEVRSPVRDIIRSFNKTSDHNKSQNIKALASLSPLPLDLGENDNNKKTTIVKKLQIKWPPVVSKPVICEKEIKKLSLVNGSPQKEKPTRNASMKIRWNGPTYYNIHGHPLYMDELFYDDNGNELSFAPLIENRFLDGKTSDDSRPSMPQRARSDSNDQCHNDTTPKPPARTPLDDDVDDWSEEENIDNGNKYKQPDVWATPTTNNDETIVSRKRWKVKRVWYVDEIDEQEKEHEVESSDLMNKVKELLGVPTASSTAEAEYDAAASNWKVKKVIDAEGQVQEESKTQKMDEGEVLVNMTEMEKEYDEVIGKWAYHGDDEGQEGEDPDWQVPEFVEDDGQEEVLPSDALKESEQEKEISPNAFLVDEESKKDPPQAKSSNPPVTPKKKKKKDKKKKPEDDEYDCIFNLLSPPPVTIISSNLSSDWKPVGDVVSKKS